MISGKEALDAIMNGKDVEYLEDDNKWHLIDKEFVVISALIDCKLRLKPRTITINGVEVGRLVSAEWNGVNPEIVSLEFNSEDEARWFQTKALEIFNDH